MKIKLRCLCLMLFSCVLTTSAYAADVLLKNGDRVTGRLVVEESGAYVIETEAMGTVTIQKEFVNSFVSDAKDKPLAPVKEKLEALDEKIQEIDHWDGEVRAGFDRRSGNTNTAELNAGFLLHRKIDEEDKKNEFTLKGDAYYSSEDKKMNSRKYKGMARYAFSFGEKLKWYNFYKVEADSDRFSNIEYRVIPSAGIGYWLYDEERTKAMAEVALGYSRTSYLMDRPVENELILIPRAYFEKTLFANTKISEDITVYPSLTEPGDYRLISETVLDQPMSEHLSLRFTFLDEYNSNPGGGAKKNDTRLTSSLVYSF